MQLSISISINVYIYIHAYGTWFNTYCEHHSSTNHDIKSSKTINTNHFRYNMFKMMSQRKVYFNDSQWSATPVILDFPIAILRVFNITRSPRVIHQEPIIHQSYSLVVTHQEWSSSSMFPHLQHPQITPHPRLLVTKERRLLIATVIAGGKCHKKMPKNQYKNYSANVISYRNQFQCYSATMQYANTLTEIFLRHSHFWTCLKVSSIPIKTYKRHPLR